MCITGQQKYGIYVKESIIYVQDNRYDRTGRNI